MNKIEQKLEKISIFDSFTLKVIAVFAMLIDHIAVIFYQSFSPTLVMQMRIVGRLAFPIFAFLVVQSFLHTSNRINYLARILGFGVAMILGLTVLSSFGVQVPTVINIFITLGLGFIAIWLIEQFWDTSKIITTLFVLSILMVAEIIHTDYAAYGVATIILFYITREHKIWMMFGFAALTGASVMFEFLRYENASLIQLFAIASVLLLALYNGKKGKFSFKYFFYFFYPIHFIVLSLIRYMMLGY